MFCFGGAINALVTQVMARMDGWMDGWILMHAWMDIDACMQLAEYKSSFEILRSFP